MSTKKVVDFVSEVCFENIPDGVIRQAKNAIKDVIGISIAAHADKAVRAARRMALSREGRPESSLIGENQRLPCEAAAFVNAVMASTLDMDDGSMGLPSHLQVHRGHPGGIIVPAALAVAEKVNASGQQLIAAVVAGYEVALLTAWLKGETVLAGVTGVFGAAAAASKLLGLNREQMIEAFNVASAHAPWPSYAFIWTHIGMTKEAAAWAANTGITAALLAQQGFTGTPSYFDLPGHDTEPFDSLGRDWEIMGLYFKLYSACRHAHAPIDGVLELMNQHALRADDIFEVIIGCASAKGLNMSCPRPATIWQAQYSIPFVIGAAMLEGEAGPDQVAEDRLSDPLILCQADKVKLAIDVDVEELQPAVFAARVTVLTKDGVRHEIFIRHPKGDPENPLDSVALEEKFKRLSGRTITPVNADKLWAQLDGLEQATTLENIMDGMRNLGSKKRSSTDSKGKKGY